MNKQKTISGRPCDTCFNMPITSNGMYRGTCKQEEYPAFVFIRYPLSLVQNLKNSLIKNLPIHGNYTGRVIGMINQVDSVEGCWPTNLGLMVLRFECMCEAEKWVTSTPDIKQQDWIGGVDIVAAPCRTSAISTKKWMELLEIRVKDQQSFLEEFAPKSADYLSKTGADVGIVTTSEVKTFRGLWSPAYLVVNQFDCKEHFQKIYCGEEYQPLKLLRNQTADCKVYLGKLEPLCD